MWITGNDAINRFDGNYVKVYKKDHYFENCKNLQQGYGFVEDEKFNIYIGSTNGLYIYKRHKDKFNAVFLMPNGQDQTIIPIGFSDGKIWCHNKEFNIISYDIKTNTSKVFKTSSGYKLTSLHIYDNRENPQFSRLPLVDIDKNIWIINPEELLFFDPKTETLHRFLEKYLTEKKLKIYSSCYDRFSNSILIGTSNSLLVFHCDSKIVEEKLKDIKIASIAVSKEIVALRDKENFQIYDKNFNRVYSQKLGENFATSYSYSFDKMNRLWVCRDGFGQIIVDFKEPFLNRVSSANDFLKSGVGCFTEFSDGDYLIQHDIIYNKEKKSFKKIKVKEDNSVVFTQNVTDTKNKKIWQIIQHNDETVDLYFIDEHGKQEFYCNFLQISKLGLLQDAILLKRQLLCSFQSGLYLIDIDLKSFKKLKNQSKINAFKINPISRNRVLVSYLNQEASVYQLNEKNEIAASKNILNGHQPFYFEEDTTKNVIWSGTNNGILILDKNFKIIKKVDANNNLAGTYIYGILLDEKGNCWASHQRGLSFINGNNYNIINFTKEDGIQDWDFNNRAYYKATDGTLFFGGMKGFNYFKPPLKYDNDIYQSKVYIDEISINQEIFFNDKNNDFIEKLQLQHDQNNVSIHAIVRNIYKGKQSPIVYRINQSKWIFKESDCVIDLVNLAPDEYKLELGVYDKFESKTIVQKTLFITIYAPFYYKIWFWAIISFAVAGFLFWIFNKQKFANQKRKFEQQLALEQQRSKITADLHDEIGSTLSSLQINSNVAHKLIEKDANAAKKVLSKLEEQSKSLADKIGDIIWSMKPGKDEFMTLSTRIKNFTSDILENTEIDYIIDIDAKIDTKIININARKNIVFFIKEVVNNAVKYSKATYLSVLVKEENNYIYIEITDNGVGFEICETKGNGIGNMKKRMEELNGEFNIHSEIDKGTSITARIPFSLN